MKKIKLLTPILGVAALVPAATQVLTSCGVSETNIIPESLLDIDDYTLKGFKEDADLSKYTTLVIPNGIKYIDDNAFANKFVAGGVWSNIQNVVFPTSLREIRSGAFNGCTSLRILDFTEWTVDQIYYLDVANELVQNTKPAAFKNTYISGNVYTSDSLSDEAKEELETRLTNGELSPVWFTKEVEDRVSADATWKEQTEESGVAHFRIALNVSLPENTYLSAYVTRTGGTTGVDIECDHTALEFDNNVSDFGVNLVNQTKTGDYCDFDVTIVAVKVNEEEEEANATSAGTEILWKQTLTGFKLTNTQPETVTVREVRLATDTYEVETESTLQIQYGVYPENAVDKTLVWTSSNNEVATVDQTGKVTGVTDGVVTITATAKDTGKVSASVDLRVKASGITLDQVYLPYFWVDFSSGTKFEANTKYTFIFDTSKFESSFSSSYNYYIDYFGIYDSDDDAVGSYKSCYITYQPKGGEEVELIKGTDYFIEDGYYGGNYIEFNKTSSPYYYTFEPGGIFRITITFDEDLEDASYAETYVSTYY